MEELKIPKHTSRREVYESLAPQLSGLIKAETDLIANMANTAAVLKEGLGFFWVGFYLVKDDQLVLGPFQGPLACTRISLGEGVCGTSWQKKETIIVPDVDQFPGHIVCSSESKSEIVVPGLIGGEVVLVLDVDSIQISDFDEIDKKFLKEIVQLILDQHY